MLAALLFLAGGTIAPTFAVGFGLVGAAAPPGATTEAFAWLGTSLTAGLALGAAGGGVLAQRVGVAAAFGLAAVAAALTPSVRWRGRSSARP